MREGGEWYKDRGKCIKKFRIEFSDPMLMTLDKKNVDRSQSFWKNVQKMQEKIGEKLFPSHFGFWLKN